MSTNTTIQDMHEQILHAIGMAQSLFDDIGKEALPCTQREWLEGITCQAGDLLEMLLEIGDFSCELSRQPTDLENGGAA